jgi:universal stress protein E
MKPDLVLKDVAADSTLHRLLFQPRDWKLVRYCPSTVMLVHPNSAVLPTTILAAIDAWMDTEADGTLNQSIYQAAEELGRECGAEVHVASSFPWIKLYSAPNQIVANAYADAERSFDQKLKQIALSMHIADDHLHRLRGHAALALADCTRKIPADLLVIGSHYRSGIDRLFLGNTAEETISHIQGDVVIVKPTLFMEELQRHLDLDAIRLTYRDTSSAIAAAA